MRDRWSPGMVLAAALLSVYFLLVLYPLVWMVLSSLKTEREFFRNLWGLPAVAQWANYVKAWNTGISGYVYGKYVTQKNPGSTPTPVPPWAAWARPRR